MDSISYLKEVITKPIVVAVEEHYIITAVALSVIAVILTFEGMGITNLGVLDALSQPLYSGLLGGGLFSAYLGTGAVLVKREKERCRIGLEEVQAKIKQVTAQLERNSDSVTTKELSLLQSQEAALDSRLMQLDRKEHTERWRRGEDNEQPTAPPKKEGVPHFALDFYKGDPRSDALLKDLIAEGYLAIEES